MVLLTFATVSWQKGSAAQVEQPREPRKLGRSFAFVCSLTGPSSTKTRPRARGRGRESGIRRGRLPQPAERGAALGTPAGRGHRADRWSGLRPSRHLDAVAEAYGWADLIIDLSGDSYRDPPGGFALAHHAGLPRAQERRTICPGLPVSRTVPAAGPAAHSLFSPTGARRLCPRTAHHGDPLAVGQPRGTHSHGAGRRVRFAGGAGGAPPRGRRAGARSSEASLDWPVAQPSRPSSRRALRTNPYLEEMARTAAHMQRVHGGTVLLIPHEITPFYGGPDDRREESPPNAPGRPPGCIPFAATMMPRR